MNIIFQIIGQEVRISSRNKDIRLEKERKSDFKKVNFRDTQTETFALNECACEALSEL